MKCIDIAADQWPRFCDDFSRLHRGWLVTTRVVEGVSRVPVPTRCTARDLPFAGLSLEPNQRDLLMRFGEGKLHISERVRGATRLCMMRSEDGADAGLQIDKADDTGILLMFRSPVPPALGSGEAAFQRSQGVGHPN
ncbi:MAG: hypothetical protein FJ189_07265 [Gammaproteobacteria bacterium]|nr:hypothetical protein [Gammaproteobacteria bacterium]